MEKLPILPGSVALAAVVILCLLLGGGNEIKRFTVKDPTKERNMTAVCGPGWPVTKNQSHSFFYWNKSLDLSIFLLVGIIDTRPLHRTHTEMKFVAEIVFQLIERINFLFSSSLEFVVPTIWATYDEPVCY